MYNLNLRPHGLGNRILSMIHYQGFAHYRNKDINMYWDNSLVGYPILLKGKYFNIQSSRKYTESEVLKLSDDNLNFKDDFFMNSNNNIEEYRNLFTTIKPTFDIKFENNIKPIGLHIRGTDRIGEWMTNYEFEELIKKSVEFINSNDNKFVFICSENLSYKKSVMSLLNDDINVVEPICDIPKMNTNNMRKCNISTYDENNNLYKDFFALTLCDSIYKCSIFSTFSLSAAVVGNLPLYYFNKKTEKYLDTYSYSYRYGKFIYLN